MEFVLIKKVFASVSMPDVHPALIYKRAFTNASPNDLVVDGKHDDVIILRKDFYNLSYSYRLDEHTHINVVKELIEMNNQ